MKDKLLAYKIGLGVVGLFTFIMLIIVLTSAGGAKKDEATTKAASDVANNLNQYTIQNQKVPDSLAQAGSKNVPSAIKYTKLNDQSYKLCVSYHGAHNDYSPGVLAFDAYSQSYNTDEWAAQNNTSYLYIPTSHKKGDNCITVKPDMYQQTTLDGNRVDTSTGSGAPSSPLKACGQTVDSESVYQQVVSFTPPTNTSTGTLVVKQPYSTGNGQSTYTVSSSLNVFDTACTALSANSVLPGDMVDLYLSGTPAQVITILRY